MKNLQSEEEGYGNANDWDIRGLARAMIHRAALDLCGDVYEDEELGEVMQDALEWFQYRGQEPFSYRWCCDVLELNPRYVLQGVAKHGMQNKLPEPMVLERLRS